MKRVLIGLLIFLMFTGLIKIIKAAPDCDYLILIPQHTKEDFENSILTGLTDFIQFKEESGFKVKVETVEEVEKTMDGRDRAEKIRNYLKEIYFTGGKLKYVLLIGDVGQYWYFRDQSDGDMPLRLIFPSDGYHDWQESAIRDYLTWPREYTDLYYANLTLDWDRDGDGFFEKEDIDDSIPEIQVFVGRIPFSSYLIVDKILQQIIAYEKPYEKQRKEILMEKILFADANITIYKNEISTFAYFAEDFAKNHRNDKFIITTMSEKEGDAIPLVASDLSLTKENLIQEMLKEYDLVHLSGYSTSSALGDLGAPYRIVGIDINKNGIIDDDNGIKDDCEKKIISLLSSRELRVYLSKIQSIIVVQTDMSSELSANGFAKLLLLLTQSPAVIGYSFFNFTFSLLEKVKEFDIRLFEKLIQGLSIGEAFYQSYLDFRDNEEFFTNYILMMASPLLLGDPSLVVFPLEPPKIKVIPEELDFGYGRENFLELRLEIRNEGGEDLLWFIEEFPPWIKLEKKEGTIKGRSSENITLFLDREILSSGENVCGIVIDSNAGSVEIQVKAIKDDIPPQIILEPIDNIVNSKTITIKGKIIDSLSGVHPTITINSENVILQDNFFEDEIALQEGENKIEIIAIDKVGNKTEMKILVVCDTIPPEIVCSLPEKVDNEFFTIKGSVKDKNTVQSLTINKKEIALKENTFQYTISLSEGNNIVIIEAEDIAGNRTTKSFNIEYIKRTILKLQIGNKTMYVNDTPQKIDIPPIIIEGRTLLPIRWVAEPLGAEVEWDGNERKVTVTLKNTKIELWIGKNIARVNGVDTPIDPDNPKVVPIIINGRTMLPVRFVAENLGCKVDWDPDTKTVTITYPKD